MTITFQDAKRISGLSTDTKPTNVASGSIFLETDAGKRYFSDGSNWVAEV